MAAQALLQGLARPDPAAFRAPRSRDPTRHLYIAKCGRGCGDTPESVLATLCELVPQGEVEGLYVGPQGISYATFATPASASLARDGVATATRWVVKFADYAEVAPRPVLPTSVASTADVEVPGLELVEGFVSEAEAQRLLQAVYARPWSDAIRRRVQHYGHAFDYSRLAIADSCEAKLPDFARDLVSRLDFDVNQLTVNEYEPGVGIAAHCDAHSAFGAEVAALSLGSGIVMEFRRPGPDGEGKVSVGRHHRLAPPAKPEVLKSVWLPPNSLLVMRGEARYGWQHGIAWRKTDCLTEGVAVPRGRRVSFTLRAARGHPCSCQWPLLCDSQNPEAHVLPSRLNAPAHPPVEADPGRGEV